MNSSQNSDNKNSLAVDFLMPGTVIGSPLFDKKGNKLHEAKIPLTQELIQKFKDARIDRIFYLKNYQEETYQNPQSNQGNDIKKNRSKLLDPKIVELAKKIAGEIAGNIKNNEFIQTTALQALTDILLKFIRPNTPIPEELLETREYQQSFPEHALHVTILSMLLSIRHGFERPLTKQIGIAAFLHDIGKIKLSPALCYAETPLNEAQQNELKRHAALGFELIKLNGQLTGIVRKIVLLHHEGVDGHGYPLGLKEKEVGYYPYIIGITDHFDNLLSNTSGEPAMHLKEALQQIIAQAGKRYPPFLVQKFIKTISESQLSNNPYSPGCFVSLTTGEIAQITKFSQDKIELRVIRDEKGKSVDPPTLISITRNSHKKIKEKLNNEIQTQLLRRYPIK